MALKNGKKCYQFLATKKRKILSLRGFDSNATLLLIFTGICKPHLTGFRLSNNTGFRYLQMGRNDQIPRSETRPLSHHSIKFVIAYERVGEGGLSVIDVGNDGHVSDVCLLVHHPTDFVDSKVHLQRNSHWT